ncbi:hypothetical protein PR002_g29611 [Phytophthora rubi]|uniref:Uncharacterized protein n=1 Tax=Phytophthora rubi TaxID=129364 RepID=A0A6A3H095_9STRA|nr:hypothetical protein PR002_g29611 [Phytophthora rubi]
MDAKLRASHSSGDEAGGGVQATDAKLRMSCSRCVFEVVWRRRYSSRRCQAAIAWRQDRDVHVAHGVDEWQC